MSKQPNDRGNSDREGESSEESDSLFAWEFDRDEPYGKPPTSLPTAIPFVRQDPPDVMGVDGQSKRDTEKRWVNAQSTSGTHSQTRKQQTQSRFASDSRFGPGRANYIRDQLDRALDRWWALGELPPRLLLRDALLLLESGGSASESHRTLLLRTALAYDKGIQTALLHQVDFERVALVLAEALVEWEVPIAPDHLCTILSRHDAVMPLLVGELERSRILLAGEARQRAQVALEILSRETNVVRNPHKPPLSSPSHIPSHIVSGRLPLRQVTLIFLLLAVVGFVLWQQRQTTPEGMIVMPAATYTLIGADGSAHAVRLEQYLIDRFEVTNRDYRSCIEAGGCQWPLRPTSATHEDYFTNPAFNENPVVNVTQEMAASYCAWQRKRLPTADEWQAAASVAVTTGQAYQYPWGESFESQRTNGASTNLGDTVVIGSFRPAGDSPSGAVDMAGNVAEWTATLVGGSERIEALVKGGSFMSDAEGLMVRAKSEIAVTSGFPDLGFRCARTQLLPAS